MAYAHRTSQMQYGFNPGKFARLYARLVEDEAVADATTQHNVGHPGHTPGGEAMVDG